MLPKHWLFGDVEEKRPVGLLPRTPCGCAIAAIAFQGSLYMLKELARTSNREEVRKHLKEVVIPNQEDFNKICLEPKGLRVVGARDILEWDLRKKDWRERVRKEADLLIFRIQNTLSECLEKEVIRGK